MTSAPVLDYFEVMGEDQCSNGRLRRTPLNGLQYWPNLRPKERTKVTIGSMILHSQ